jgi:hypothetical protein
MKGPYYCGYCHKRGHPRALCPALERLVQRAKQHIDIELETTPLIARTRKLKARWRVEEHQDINAFYDLSALNHMKQVRVEKKKLLAILRENRSEHRKIFLEAQVAYRKVAIALLDEQLKLARKGRPFVLQQLTQLMPPTDRTADYDRSIQMLEMSVEEYITIDEREFQNYVQDVWGWSRDWAANSLRYVSSGANKNSRTYTKLCSLAGEDEL